MNPPGATNMKTPTNETKELVRYETERLKIHRGWAIALTIVVILICGTILFLYSHPFTFRIEMDNNTLQAVQSINWSAIPK